MNEILSPFTSKQKLLQILICTLVFIGMAVPFKVMVLIPGLTEVRPVNAVPVVAGLLFGPAGAWGCAIGNLIGDLFGTFSKASILGFLGNFIAAYIPYKMWHMLKSGEKPNVKTYKNIGLYIIISVVASLSTSIFIAFGLDVIIKFWSRDIFCIILLNDFCFPVFIGLPTFIVLTCDDHKIQPTMPLVQKNRSRYMNICLALFIISQIVILFMVLSGLNMSGYILLWVCIAIFLASLTWLVMC